MTDHQSRKLSTQQKEFLEWVYRTTLSLQESDRYLEAWGVFLLNHPRRKPRWMNTPNRSASDRASFSRMMKRLEQRGLIIRQNDWTNKNKTTCVKLTDLGEEVAKRLTLLPAQKC